MAQTARALRVSDPGILSEEHLASIALQGQHGISLNQIHYQGSARSWWPAARP